MHGTGLFAPAPDRELGSHLYLQLVAPERSPKKSTMNAGRKLIALMLQLDAEFKIPLQPDMYSRKIFIFDFTYVYVVFDEC